MDERPDSTSKAAIPLALLKSDIAFVKRLFTSRGKRAEGHGASGYRRDVAYAGMREMLGGLSAQQVQFMTPTTDKMYGMVAKAKKAAPRSVDLGGGAQGHWIGASQAKYAMLYFHGGGFYGAATVGHMRYLYTLQEEMKKLGHDFAIFALTYTLAPGAVYPTQLRQAASALTHLLTQENRDPSMILLGGDSAGGNLAAALLLHLAHPHPSVPAVPLNSTLSPSRRLRAALLISPWVSFRTDLPSFASNAEADYIGPRALRRAATTYIAPGTQHDAYSEPAESPAEWWVDVGRDVLTSMMIWVGGGEVLLDGARAFADKVEGGFRGELGQEEGGKKTGARFSFVVTPGCAHEEMIIDELTMGLAKGDASREIERWLSSALS